MGVTLVPVSVDSHGVAIFILGDCGDHIGALWSGGKSEFGLKKGSSSCLLWCYFYGLDIYDLKLLQHANVDTFIVFRSCCPLLVLLLEYLYLIKGGRKSVEKME